MMKFMLWLYAIVGTLYFVLYASGMPQVVQYARGPLWLLMQAAPAVLALLVTWPFVRRFLP